MLKKLLWFSVLINLLILFFNFKISWVSVGYPILLLNLFLAVSFYRRTLLVNIFKFVEKRTLLIIIIFVSFLVRFLGIFYPEHHGLVEQEIYTLPVVAAYSGDWIGTFKEFTSFEFFGLFLQTIFFKITTYFDFGWFINLFGFLFPEHYFFLNIPSPEVSKWPSWTVEGRYGLPGDLADRYGLNYFFIRLVSVLFGTGTVFLTYLVGKKMYNKRVGLFSSLVLGVTFIHVVMSMIGRLYVISTFFVVLLFLACFTLAKKGKFRNYFFSGLVLGLVNSVKIFPASLSLLLTASVLTLTPFREVSFGIFFKRTALFLFMISVAFVVFIIGSPGIFFYPEHTFNTIYSSYKAIFISGTWGMNYYSPLVGLPSWLWWPHFLSESGLFFPIIASTFLGLLIVLYRVFTKFRKEEILLLSVMVPYYYSLMVAASRREEFVVFITPFFALFSGIFLDGLVNLVQKIEKKEKRQRQMLIGGVLTIFLLVPFLRIVLFDYSVLSADNRTKVALWLEREATKGSFIYKIGNYNQKIPLSRTDYIQAGEDLMDQDFNYYLAIGADYLVVPAVKDLGQFVYHPKEYVYILNFLKLRHNGVLEAEFYRPFFKESFFSPIITSGDLINENFDSPLQIYKLKRKEGEKNVFVFDANFLGNPKAIFLRKVEGFSLKEDENSALGVSLSSERRGSFLTIVPKLGRGNYTVTFRLKTDNLVTNSSVVMISLSETNDMVKARKYLLRSFDFNKKGTFNDFSYSLALETASPVLFHLETLTEKPFYLESITLAKIL